ncbi:MAG: VWA domain-containing protein [Anaerolineae bacterium]
MRQRIGRSMIGLFLFPVLVAACSSGALPLTGGKTVTISMVYGSEKEAWLVPLIESFNAQKNKTEQGTAILVEATPMGSIASGDGIVDGTLRPTIWSPASSAYVPVANTNWRREHGEDLVLNTPNDLVLSPVVIAMWRPMAEALGWPDESLGWADIAEMATSDEGWGAFGYPEWGSFKFGHTHPNFSNSGIISVIAEAYAGAGKQRNLTLEDLRDPGLKAFMTDVESSVIHYGESTGFFARRMFERGPSYLSAAVMYENLIAAQEAKRLNGESNQPPVVAIYPKEGTFWSNHPYIILNAPWVSDEQREAAEIFEDFLLAEPQQRRSIEYGFRPSDPEIALTSPLDVRHGVDPTQPQTILEVPSGEVVVGIQELWRSEAKKPVDVVVLMDTSGSMEGEKISSARSSLIQFIDLMDDRDRLEVILFSDEMITLTDLSPLGEKRQDVRNRVSGVIEGGDTKLYSTIELAYRELEAKGDPDHIRAIVALTDGRDTASDVTLPQLLDQIGAQSESGDATKIFTIAFGQAADREVMQQIAEITGGKQYDSDPQTIGEIYAEIATFF